MFQLEIVTPERLFFSDQVERVIVRGMEGDLAILKNRTPITTPLKICKIRILQDGKEKIGAVSNGYISVVGDKTTIVTDAAEWPDEIDVERAEAAKKRAEKRLKSESPDIDTARAELALKRAINRLDLTK